MQNNIPERLLPFNLDLIFRHRLGRNLLLLFLGLAVIPMAVVSVISYQTAYQRIEQDVRLNISMAAELKSSQIQAFFDDWLRLFNHGFDVAGLANSDSHGTDVEVGLPRNWVASPTDSPPTA